jgi:hypothetical protein
MSTSNSDLSVFPPRELLSDSDPCMCTCRCHCRPRRVSLATIVASHSHFCPTRTLPGLLASGVGHLPTLSAISSVLFSREKACSNLPPLIASALLSDTLQLGHEMFPSDLILAQVTGYKYSPIPQLPPTLLSSSSPLLEQVALIKMKGLTRFRLRHLIDRPSPDAFDRRLRPIHKRFLFYFPALLQYLSPSSLWPLALSIVA